MELKEMDEKYGSAAAVGRSNQEDEIDASINSSIPAEDVVPDNGRRSEPELEEKPTSSPEVELHIFRKGKGPIEVLKSKLGGWDQDRLEVQDILEKYRFKSIFAFNVSSGNGFRGAPIRFSTKNGRSLISYKPGSIINVDGEPQDSLIKPVTKILSGVAVTILLISVLLREKPEWLKKSQDIGNFFPPWVLACMVIVFLRLRKRTVQFFRRFG